MRRPSKDMRDEVVADYFKDNGYNTSNSGFVKSTSLNNDQYFTEMNTFIDDKLTMVADAVAEKKTQKEIKRQNKDQLRKTHIDNQLLNAKNEQIENQLEEMVDLNTRLALEHEKLMKKLKACKDLMADT